MHKFQSKIPKEITHKMKRYLLCNPSLGRGCQITYAQDGIDLLKLYWPRLIILPK